ncbi:hypothetical protein LPB41_15680 [Thalassospira sp. MA62]|nr:hypothetical protein [Thalassospira sp. MA62]
MVHGINNSPSLLATSQSPIASTNNRENAGQNDGILARGVGMLQKAWLHLTGQAKSTHNSQLNNLRTEVRNNFGEAGLAALNQELNNRNLDGANSTHVFSSAELNGLREHAEAAPRYGLDEDAMNALGSQTDHLNEDGNNMRHGRRFIPDDNASVSTEGRPVSRDSSMDLDEDGNNMRYGRRFSTDDDLSVSTEGRPVSRDSSMDLDEDGNNMRYGRRFEKD